MIEKFKDKAKSNLNGMESSQILDRNTRIPKFDLSGACAMLLCTMPEIVD